MKVLIIEDDYSSELMLRRKLENLGISSDSIISTDSFDVAAELLESKANRFDICFLDLVLEKMGRWSEPLEFIKKFSSTSIVVMTGHSNPSLPVLCFAAGALDFFNKDSCTKDQLSRVITYAEKKKELLSRGK